MNPTINLNGYEAYLDYYRDMGGKFKCTFYLLTNDPFGVVEEHNFKVREWR